MANLLDSVENSVWHAFDYLALEGDGTAQKSKLKVSWLLGLLLGIIRFIIRHIKLFECYSI